MTSVEPLLVAFGIALNTHTHTHTRTHIHSEREGGGEKEGQMGGGKRGSRAEGLQ